MPRLVLRFQHSVPHRYLSDWSTVRTNNDIKMAPPPPEIASETILLVLLTTWRCLVAALPLQQDVFVLNVCDWLGLHSPYPIWLYKVSGPRRFNNPLLPEHDHLYDAMVAFCLCEVFCSFMFPHVERLLSRE